MDLTGYAAIMGTVFQEPKEGEPGTQSIALNKIVCGPSESHLVLLQLETYCSRLSVLTPNRQTNPKHASFTCLCLLLSLFVLLVLQSLMNVCLKYVFRLSATSFQTELPVRLLVGGKPKVYYNMIFHRFLSIFLASIFLCRLFFLNLISISLYVF